MRNNQKDYKSKNTSKGQFRTYLNSIGLKEDVGTGSGDIAGFTGKLDLSSDEKPEKIKRTKYLEKGKKCRKHGILNCEKCEDELYESKWN